MKKKKRWVNNFTKDALKGLSRAPKTKWHNSHMKTCSKCKGLGKVDK